MTRPAEGYTGQTTMRTSPLLSETSRSEFHCPVTASLIFHQRHPSSHSSPTRWMLPFLMGRASPAKRRLMLTIDDIRARERRPGELSRGLKKERAIIREANDPLLYLERLTYLHALGDEKASGSGERTGGGWVPRPLSHTRAFMSIQALHLTRPASRLSGTCNSPMRAGQVSLAVRPLVSWRSS
jgi:hypothetical protein